MQDRTKNKTRKINRPGNRLLSLRVLFKSDVEKTLFRGIGET